MTRRPRDRLLTDCHELCTGGAARTSVEAVWTGVSCICSPSRTSHEDRIPVHQITDGVRRHGVGCGLGGRCCGGRWRCLTQVSQLGRQFRKRMRKVSKLLRITRWTLAGVVITDRGSAGRIGSFASKHKGQKAPHHSRILCCRTFGIRRSCVSPAIMSACSTWVEGGGSSGCIRRCSRWCS